MKKTTALFFICLLVLLSSCSSKLSKEEASEIISLEYPNFCTSKKFLKRIQTWTSDSRKARIYRQKQLAKLYELEKKDLITIKQKHTGFDSNPDIEYYFELTETAKKKYRGYIPMTTNEFVEVIGISQNENEATVKYTLKSTKTPFYILLNENVKTPRCYENQWEQDIVLVKFDTGWRIKK